MSAGKQIIFGFFIVIGIAMAVIFGLLPTVVEKKIESTILAGTILTPAGEGLTQSQYNDWVVQTLNVDYYIWNVTNLPALMTQSYPYAVKPALVQAGPFSYTKQTTKYHIIWDNNNYTVSYYTYVQWFRKVPGQLSQNNEPIVDPETIVTTLNLPYAVAISSFALLGNDATETNLHFGLAYKFLIGGIYPLFFNTTSSIWLGNGLKIMLSGLFIGTIEKVATEELGSGAAAEAFLLNQWSNSSLYFSGYTCSSPCIAPTTCLTFANTGSPVSRCAIGSSFWTGAGLPDISGLFEPGAAVSEPNAFTLLFNQTHPYGLTNPSNVWLTAVSNPPASLAGCFPYLGPTDCVTVATWLGSLTNAANPKATQYFQFDTIALASVVPGNPYNIPYYASVSGWSDLVSFQFGTCGLARTLSYGTASSIAQLIPALSTQLNGVYPEICAQRYRSPLVLGGGIPIANWTISTVNTFAGTLLSELGFLGQLASCDVTVPSIHCLQLIDYLYYLGKYGVFLPTIVGTNWNQATGVPNWNAWGTGACWNPTDAIPFNPSASFGTGLSCPPGVNIGGSGLFVTRPAEEILLGYLDEVIVPGGAYGGAFGPNTTTPQLPLFTAAYTPGGYKGPYSVYTGADGDNSRITFYQAYLGSSEITTVNDFYDAGSAPRICLPPGTPRYSYDPGCSIWQASDVYVDYGAEEVIDETSDGTKAPYMFQEGKAQLPIYVWVDEGARQVQFNYLDSETFENINVWKYTMDAATLYNTTDPRNYNPDLAKHYYTINHPSGVVSVQRANAIDQFLSKPQFLDGDIAFHLSQLSIPDLNPTASLHDTYIDVEPLTGRVFSGRKRLQTGLYLSTQRLIKYLWGGVYGPIVANYPGNNGTVESTCNGPSGSPAYTCTFPAWGSSANNLYWPILWATEGQDISTSDANTFVTDVYGTRKTFFITQIVLVIVGGIMFFTFLILCIKARQASTSL